MSKDESSNPVPDISGTGPAAVSPVAPEPPTPTGAATKEIGGPKGPEPTRYGDWEVKGRCIDF